MSDLTKEQIEQAFKRQVFLCSGIGEQKMLELVKAYFAEKRSKEPK